MKPTRDPQGSASANSPVGDHGRDVTTDSAQQRPLDTGFSAASTVDDVLQGVDLVGDAFIVTAGHTGIGAVLTKALAGAGALVTVACRNPGAAANGFDGIRGVEFRELDLLDPRSVDSFVESWLESGRSLAALINNAGVPAPPERVVDQRGYEVQFATNFLGHFQLTAGLYPALASRGGGRVVNVSSGAHRFADIRWDDPHFEDSYDPTEAYAQSKTAVVLASVEQERRWAGDGVRAFAAHPGVVVGTSVNSAVGAEQLLLMGLIDEAGNAIIDPEAGKKTPAQGASTLAFAATSPLLTGLGGVYLLDNDVSEVDDKVAVVSAERIPAQVAPHAIDRGSAKRLWAMGEDLLGDHLRRSP